MLLRLCVLLGVAFLARAEGPPPEQRTALIIGNAVYSFAPLKNPINDAEAMASALEAAGFKVIKETNADQAKMVEAVTETLDLVANAAPGDIGLSEGSYKVEGKNADGSTYQGNVVEITKQGRSYHLTWQVGSSSYEGDGRLDGNLLTVDWGAATPVVYALGDDGSLTGLWDAGNGEETLTPEE